MSPGLFYCYDRYKLYSVLNFKINVYWNLFRSVDRVYFLAFRLLLRKRTRAWSLDASRTDCCGSIVAHPTTPWIAIWIAGTRAPAVFYRCRSHEHGETDGINVRDSVTLNARGPFRVKNIDVHFRCKYLFGPPESVDEFGFRFRDEITAVAVRTIAGRLPVAMPRRRVRLPFAGSNLTPARLLSVLTAVVTRARRPFVRNDNNPSEPRRV